MTRVLEASTKLRFNFDQTLDDLKGVGPHTKRCLVKLNLHTFRDLLFHFPLRYEDRTRITPVRDLKANDKVLVQGKITGTKVHQGRKRWLELILQDGSSVLSIVLFHFSKKQLEVLSRKPLVRCYGVFKINAGKRSLVHPEFQFLKSEQEPLDEELTPIYPTTQGLYQNLLRKLIRHVLDMFVASNVTESLPNIINQKYDLMRLDTAIEMIHYPSNDVNLEALIEKHHPAFKRLIVEEVLTHFITLKQQRQRIKKEKSQCLLDTAKLISPFVEKLPFELTGAQKRAYQEIRHDLSLKTPMMRLVQGDVGSGKTVIAAMAALHALSNQTQAAMLAPTDILAEQHYLQFKEWFELLGLEVIYLSGKTPAKLKREHLEKISSQTPLMVVGTHAIFQESVIFKQLSLMIVDEQHRFGVHQRLQLKEKGQAFSPHQLVMTATPIPRTLAMTQYRDLDITVIDELPPGRKDITTLCLGQVQRTKVIERIHEVILQGQQIYWVCPLIEESEKLQIQAAEIVYEELKNNLGAQVACIHGRMKPSEKDALMAAFKANEIKVLVATTVIEVGVNVPNATLMVIENAERLGLAQLHQLRGRVGRGAKQSFCVLLFKSPLSPHGKQRLEVMRQTNDGFKIAEMDLKIRGPGEVLGVRQTGLQAFRVADLLRDQTLIHELNDFVEHQQDLNRCAKRLQPVWIGANSSYQQV
jgi:ATP-dependent DNA helicase RecG